MKIIPQTFKFVIEKGFFVMQIIYHIARKQTIFFAKFMNNRSIDCVVLYVTLKKNTGI